MLAKNIVVKISVAELEGDAGGYISDKTSSKDLMFVADGLLGPEHFNHLTGIIGNEALKLVNEDPVRINKLIFVYEESLGPVRY